MKTMYAEDINFWDTGKSSPDAWIERAQRQIVALGGKLGAEAFGKDMTGRAAFMLEFWIDDSHYRIVWPVMTSRNNELLKAKRQAATALYHSVKARCLEAVVRGPRVAFAADLVLPSGQTISQMSDGEIHRSLPLLLT